MAKEPIGVDVVEEKPDPTRDALQQNMLNEYERKQNPSQWVGLPNGRSVRAVGLVEMKYPGEKAADMLGRPQDMLLKPMPKYRSGPRYQWRVRMSTAANDNRPAETQMLHRSGRIRYVETKEIDPGCPFAVFTPYGTTNNEYVTYQTLILCEILDENYVYQTYKGWEDWSLNRVMNLEATTRGEANTHIEGKTDIDVDIRDTRAGG